MSTNDTAPTLNKERVPTSCTKAFDSLYFCYSPFHQARQFYITGELDDCRGRARRFRMCVMSRFRSQQRSEEIYELEEKEEEMKKPRAEPVWEMREEYVEHMREVEMKEMRDRERKKEEEAEGDVKWWL